MDGNLANYAMDGNLDLDMSSQTKTNKRCFLGQRHVVTLIGFLYCFILNTNRLSLGVGIVAMVKHGRTKESSEWNASEPSCPLLSDLTNLTIGPDIQGEFDWSSELQGYILGAGFLSSLIVEAPAGRLADAVGSKPLLVIPNALAGILMIVSPFAARWHVYALIAVQFLRGALQGISTPTVYRMMSNWTPRSERGTLITLMVCGCPAGIAVGGMVTGWLCDTPGLGWPSAFYIWGTICFLVAVVTHFIYYEYPANNPWITEAELKYINDGLEIKVSGKRPPTPWKRIFSSITSYAYFYGIFGHYWATVYFITIHPTFMATVLHYSTAKSGLISCLPVLIACASGFLFSMVSHWVSKKNLISLNKLRKTNTGVSALGFSLCMAGMLLAGCDATISILCYALSLFFMGIGISGILISGVDMSPTFAGSLMGVTTTVGGLASFSNPVITGLMTTHETLSEWQKVFWINLGIVGTSGIVYVFFGSAEVQPWNYPEMNDEQMPQVKKYSL